MSTKIGVIGSGYWGKNLVRNFHALGALGVICDTDATRLDALHTQYPDADVSVSVAETLARPDIAGVVISSPAELHYSLARQALLAGKHIYVEKPLALDETEGAALIALARERGLVLMVGHLLQYHPVFIKLKELARAGELGRINYIYSHRCNLGKIRREENILWSFAPHDISMILSLAGEMPDAVMAWGGNWLHSQIADVTTTHMDFPSGLKAHVFVSWLNPFKEQRLVVVGDKRMAVFDDALPWEDKLLVYAHKIRWEGALPIPEKAEPERPSVPKDEPLKLECAHFLDCIASGKPPVTDGAEGLRVLSVLNAAQRSLEDRGRVTAPGVVASRQPEPAAQRPATVQGDGVMVHSTAIVDAGVTIGANTKIWHFTHVLSGSTIGSGCNLGQNVVVGPKACVGNGCKIQNNVSVYQGVTLEDDVFCGPSMVFTNVFNPRAHIRRMDEARPTLVKKGATLGANSTIVCGYTVGRYAFVGAGAVVTKDVPDHALVMGNPARQAGWVCACGEKLGDDLRCAACGAAYRQEASGLASLGEDA